MRKVIFTGAPLQDVMNQPDSEFGYKAVNNQKLEYNEGCCFPVLPLINGYVGAGETVDLYVLTVEGHEKCKENRAILEKKTRMLAKKIGAEIHVHTVHIPFDDTVETQLATFEKLIQLIKEEDVLYADITFLGRCLPIIEMMVLNFAYRTMRDVSIGAVVYGNKNFETHEKLIYDETPLFDMDQIVNSLAESNAENPVEMIKTILGINSSMDEA